MEEDAKLFDMTWQHVRAEEGEEAVEELGRCVSEVLSLLALLVQKYLIYWYKSTCGGGAGGAGAVRV